MRIMYASPRSALACAGISVPHMTDSVCVCVCAAHVRITHTVGMHQIASIIVYGMSDEILQHSPESPGLKHVALRHLSWTIAAGAA